MNPELVALVLGSVARWVTYLGVALVVGAAGAQIVVRYAWRRVGLGNTQPVERRVVQIGAWVATGLLIAAGPRIYTQAYSVFALDERVGWEALRIVALNTAWGRGWNAQLLATVVATLVLWTWPQHPAHLKRITPGIAAGIVVFVTPLTGHTASADHPVLSIMLLALHVGGVGLWIGTLAITIAMTRPGAVRLAERDAVFAAAINAFSPLAVVAVSALAITGLLTAILYLEAFRELWITGYGRMLLAKVLFFLMMGALGAYNWRRLKPKLGRADVPARLRLVAGLELSGAIVVLAVTAVLVALPLVH